VFQRGPAGVSSLAISCCVHIAALGGIVNALAISPRVPFIQSPPCPEIVSLRFWQSPPPPPPGLPLTQPLDPIVGEGGDGDQHRAAEGGFLDGESSSGPQRPDLRRIEGVCGCGVIAGIVGGLDATLPPPPPSPLFAEVVLSSRPLRVSGVTAPEKLIDVKPRYPPLARQAHIEGVVMLDLTIDETGRVGDVEVLRSVNLLERAAIDAVRRWRYAPAIVNGRRMPVLLTVTISFVL